MKNKSKNEKENKNKNKNENENNNENEKQNENKNENEKKNEFSLLFSFWFSLISFLFFLPKRFCIFVKSTSSRGAIDGQLSLDWARSAIAFLLTPRGLEVP